MRYRQLHAVPLGFRACSPHCNVFRSSWKWMWWLFSLWIAKIHRVRGSMATLQSCMSLKEWKIHDGQMNPIRNIGRIYDSNCFYPTSISLLKSFTVSFSLSPFLHFSLLFLLPSSLLSSVSFFLSSLPLLTSRLDSSPHHVMLCHCSAENAALSVGTGVSQVGKR